MFHRLFTLLSALSLLLCAASAVLWWRSDRHPKGEEDRASWVWNGRRYTVRFESGVALLTAPPPCDPNVRAIRGLPPFKEDPTGSPAWYVLPPGWLEIPERPSPLGPVSPPADAPTLGVLLAQLRNAHFRWDRIVTTAADPKSERDSIGCEYLCWPRGTGPVYGLFDHAFDTGTLMRPDAPQDGRQWPVLACYDRQAIIAALLPCLEDEDQFVAAHLLLHHHVNNPQGRNCLTGKLRETRWANVDGLNVHIGTAASGFPYDIAFDAEIRIDPTQLPRIRDQWHRRLDRLVYAVPIWIFVAAFAAVPTVRGGAAAIRAIGRRKVTRGGCCVACGYDLRATPGRCPECGAEAQSGV